MSTIENEIQISRKTMRQFAMFWRKLRSSRSPEGRAEAVQALKLAIWHREESARLKNAKPGLWRYLS